MKRLKSLPKPPDRTVKKYGARYPWAVWFAKGEFTLTRGVDYLIQPHGMKAMVYNKASALGLSVRTRLDEGVITVRVGRKG